MTPLRRPAERSHLESEHHYRDPEIKNARFTPWRGCSSARTPPSAPARWLHPAGRDLHNALAVEARYANSIPTKVIYGLPLWP